MYVKFVKDDKTIEEVSISSEMIPFPTDTVVLESAKCGLKEAKDFVDTYCDYVLND